MEKCDNWHLKHMEKCDDMNNIIKLFDKNISFK